MITRVALLFAVASLFASSVAAHAATTPIDPAKAPIAAVDRFSDKAAHLQLRTPDNLNRSLDRTEGPIILAGHAYAGAVMALARPERVKALVYVAALAPDEGEKVADVFYRSEPHPLAPKLAADGHGLIWLPESAFATAFAQKASAEDREGFWAVEGTNNKT